MNKASTTSGGDTAAAPAASVAASQGGLTRRTWLQGALGSAVGGLLLVVDATGVVSAQTVDGAARKYGADTMPGGTVDDPLVFVSIAPDGLVSIVAHRAEMGTGVRTSLPMVVADEMEARWERVTVVQADANEARWGNQNTDGSRSIRHFYQPMRRVGAAARQMLEAAAAARWGVPVGEVSAQQHEVVHAASGRRLDYGALAMDAAHMPVPPAQALKLKSPETFRYIGKGALHGVDAAAIGQGRAIYGMDTHLPGMVYAVVARPPVVGGRVRRMNREKALAVPGVMRLVDIAPFEGAPAFQPLGGVAVVARTTWAAMQGRNALEIEWDDGANARYSTPAFRERMLRSARAPGHALRSDGDALRVLGQASAARKLVAEYDVPHLAHASMEPPVATARVSADRCEIWTSVQAPQAAVQNVAARLKLKPEQVEVHLALLGGGFGRKSKPDYVVEAALVAQALPGTPVKLVWTRDDDIQHDYLHTVSLEHLEAAVGPEGLPTAWLHRTVSPSIGSLFNPQAREQGLFEVGMTALNIPYAIPNVRIEVGEAEAMTRIGWFRSVANIQHAFAVQSFVDELAHHARRDPREYALALIGPARRIRPADLSDPWNYSESPDLYPVETGRLRGVIEAATQGAGWGRTLPKGHGLGLAFAYSFMSYAATVIEVARQADGTLRVVSVDMALDCGPQINPERIRSQMEGAAIMGLSLALSSEISFAQGRVQQSNFHDYQVLRHAQSPQVIRTHLVGGDPGLPPGGVGEPPLPPVAPALCNAIFAATGKRIRRLPIRDQV